MKVEILEARLRSKGRTYERGDRTTVDDETGRRWCELGWAKDLSEKPVPTGERKPGVARIKVHSTKHRNKAR